MNEPLVSDTKTKKMRKSVKSMSNSEEHSTVSVNTAFEHLIEAACLAYACPQRVKVWKEQTLPGSVSGYTKIQEIKSKKINKSTISKTPSSKKSTVSERPNDVPEVFAVNSAVQFSAKAVPPKSNEETIFLVCLYDSSNRLTETHLCKVRHVPKILMQVLTFYSPACKHLNKIVIKQCGIDVYTIHELSKILACSLVTEVCLDDSPLPEGNYSILLDNSAHLKHLSLCRCEINDESCKQIALKLDHFATVTAKTLQLLNLTSNQITDEGAKYLALALRSNRALRYLNVSGNRITDEGAGYIFNVMMQFPLTYQECIGRKQRHLLYLKERWNCLTKNMEKLDVSKSIESSSKIQNKSNILPEKKETSIRIMNTINSSTKTAHIRSKAENMVNEFMSPFADPYGMKDVVIVDGYTHCLGNLTLFHLNLAYNNLQFPSLKKLLEVLKYQNDKQLTSDGGLCNVILLGNYLPRSCDEMSQINEYLVRKSYKPRKSKQSMASSKHRIQIQASRIKFE